MVVVTDENDIVIQVALIPGTIEVPESFHIYFPVKEKLPNIGEKFIPDLSLQPWLDPNYSEEW